MITWLQTIIAIILLYVVFEKLRQWRLEGNIPGPSTVPFFGNSLILWDYKNTQDIGRIVMKLQGLMEYGNLCRLWLGHHLIVGVADPKSLEVIFKSNELLNKSFLYDFANDIASGVFVSSGEKWKVLRKIVNKVFHNNNMENQLNVFNNSSKVLCQVLESKCDGKSFKIDNFLHRCILDITCKILASSRNDIQLKKDLTYIEDVHLVAHLSFERLLRIWLYPDFIYKHSTSGKMKQAASNRVLGFGLELINERREFLNEVENSITVEGYSNPKTFLDYMMDYAKARNLTDLELSMSITDLIVAGSDTTSCAISYMLLMLAMYQDIQEQVFEEIHEIFGDSDRAVELKDMNRMPVLERVYMEVLRHCCPPHIVRRVDSPLYLQDKRIPVGSSLYIMLYRLHRDPEYWSHPNSFYPDHFLPENVQQRPKYTFLPFVSGLRACPGQRFSFIMMKIIVSTILRQYKITTSVRPSEVKLSMTLMLEIPGGSDVQLTLR